MIYNLLRPTQDDAADTGTYADGAFERPPVAFEITPRRLRGHVSHQRDYGRDRAVTPLPVGLA